LPLNRSQKEALVEQLKDKFSRAVSVTLVDFPGLTVSQANELRAKLREVQGEIKVSKNTLFRIAIKGTESEPLVDSFQGPNAAVFAYEDPVQVAKVLMDFAKDNEVLKIKNGILNGKMMDASGIEALSKLPSREVLLAQMLSVLVATPTNLVQVLSGIPRKLLYALSAIKEKKQ